MGMIHLCGTLAAIALLTNATDVATALLGGAPGASRSFVLTGTVDLFHSYSGELIVEDDSGAVALNTSVDRSCRPGDRVRATGFVSNDGTSGNFAHCTSLEILGKRTAPVAVDADFARLRSGALDNRFVRVTGDVRDVTADEIDPKCTFVTLTSGGECIRVAVQSSDPLIRPVRERLKSLADANVSVSGLCRISSSGFRRLFGRLVNIRDLDTLTVNRPPPADPFSVPTLDEPASRTPEEISSLGRRRTAGTVIAVWDGNRFLLCDDAGFIHNVETDTSELPDCEERVEVVGLPETDLYRVNLSHATFRRIPGPVRTREAPTLVPHLANLFADRSGNRRIDPSHHGRIIRVAGTVLDLSPAHQPTMITLKDGNDTLVVDASALVPVSLAKLSVGCRLEVDGVCIVTIGNRNGNHPCVTGLTVVPQRQEDVRIISRPSYWTPGRLMAVIGILAATLLIFLVWNRVLNHLVSRRGRQLFKEQIAHAGAALRVEERTRLAVELHDSLSQNLTGISFHIQMADKLADPTQGQLKDRLSIAQLTLQSCRNELRNCIYDLRNQSLDQSDMNEAIRLALHPHLGDARLHIRFSVPRSRLSDQTAHTILRIVRELATNAVKHGHATAIDVCGARDGERLLISVRDNGDGFDPQNRPGMREGHFGLQGIAERIAALNGSVHIDSAPGKGTKVTLSLMHHLPDKEQPPTPEPA